MDYKPTIGLEIHAELKTRTKMFCSCKNDADEKSPNVNICPICLGHPGTLPVINKEAVKHVLKTGLSLGGKFGDFSYFDRKNYFYPDIPKGYQISQYKYPLVFGGELKGVKLTRIHLEEDTAKSYHFEDGESLVDFNRAGIPLMELVTEPVIDSAAKAAGFGLELQRVLQYLGVSEANMEKGEMRLEANVSVSKGENLGVKVEIKNLNSFRSAEKAINYEVERQTDILKKGGKIEQETRGWDENERSTFSQRSKESSHDYRYFPDPDLPPLKLSEQADFDEKTLRLDIEEIPEEKRTRFKKDYIIKDSDVDFYISNKGLSSLFEKAAAFLENQNEIQILSNYLVSDIKSLGGKGLSLEAKRVAKLIKMISSESISSRAAKDILQIMAETDEDPKVIAKRKKMFQKSKREELLEIAKEIMFQHQNAVADYKNGKISAIQFLVGQAMKTTKGSANPQLVQSIFEELLK